MRLLSTQKERWLHIVTQNQSKSQLKLQYSLLVASFQALHANTKLNLLDEIEKLQQLLNFTVISDSGSVLKDVADYFVPQEYSQNLV